MQIGQLTIVRTDPGKQFLAALAQNAMLTETIGPPPPGTNQGDGYVDGGIGAGYTVKARLRSVMIMSMENLAWEIGLWAKGTFNTGAPNPSNVNPLGFATFAAGDARSIAGAQLFYYYADGLDIPCVDLDRLGQIHLSLTNRSVASKSQGALGTVLVQLHLEASLGW